MTPRRRDSADHDRRFDFRLAVRIAMTLVGCAFMLAAVFALQLGLDTNASWGPSRKFLFAVGIVLAVMVWIPMAARRAWQWASGQPFGIYVGARVSSAWSVIEPRLPVARLVRRISLVSSGVSRQLHSWPLVRSLLASPTRTAVTVSLFMWVLSVLTYAWIGSVGTWTHWPPTTSDYDLLAQGFVQGRASLPLEPSPEFLAIPNPYSMASRQFMPPIWDVSYFQGKFYLYWGPVPAGLLAGLKFISPVHVDDGLLTFLFTSMAGLLGVLLILSMWRRWPKALPWWIVMPPIAVLLWATPIVWLMSRAAIYEAAIASGQCFFLAGMLALCPPLFGTPLSGRRLAAGSLLLALAIGCRMTLAPACALLLGLALIITLRAGQTTHRVWAGRLSAAAVPMMAVGSMLGLYNWVRFGSVLELGHRYQLGRWDMFDHYNTVFGLANAIPDLYNYLLNGFHSLSVFPFVKPAWGAHYIWLTHTYAPPLYHTEKVAGALVVIPFLWFSIPAIYRWARSAFRSAMQSRHREWIINLVSGQVGPEVYLSMMLIMLVAPLASFVAVSMRHEVDFVPVFVLLAAAGFWGSYESLGSRRFSWALVLLSALALAFVSVLLSVLLAMTGFQGNFETYNPVLFHNLTVLFSR